MNRSIRRTVMSIGALGAAALGGSALADAASNGGSRTAAPPSSASTRLAPPAWPPGQARMAPESAEHPPRPGPATLGGLQLERQEAVPRPAGFRRGVRWPPSR